MTERPSNLAITASARIGAALLLVGLLGVPGVADAQAEGAVGLPIGTAAPSVQIETLDGQPAPVSDQIGRRPVVVEFWATWCPICKALMPRMAAAQEAFGNRVDFVAVAVGVNESPRSIRRHLTDHPMAYRVLWDGRGAATRAYHAPTTSYIVILDADGRVAYTGVGADQDISGALARIAGN